MLGSSDFGELTEINAFGDAVSVAHGISQQCALRRSGEIWCQGINSDGQLGRGDYAFRRDWGPVSNIQDATQIVLGSAHGCAARIASGPHCWGRNDNGPVGNGTDSRQRSPTRTLSGTPLDSGVLSIATGGGVNSSRHACGVAADGGVFCWGMNNSGELGNGTKDASTTPVVARVSGAAVDVWTGMGRSCARMNDMTVECWGGQQTTPLPVPGLVAAEQLSLSKTHSCAVTSSQSAMCWGSNDDGRLGTTTPTTTVSVPVEFGDGLLDPIVQVAAGYTHTCVRTTLGQIYCAGENSHGQLGNNTTTPSTTPVMVQGLTSPAIDIAAGDDFSCAVLDNNTAMCWGDNNAGKLGVPTSVGQSLTATATLGLTNAVDIELGRYHSCAVVLAATETVSCWGSNTRGQLGADVSSSSHIPTTVPGIMDIRSLRVGPETTCVIQRSDGAVYCWGNNSRGQLGLGYFGNVAVPTPVVGLESL